MKEAIKTSELHVGRPAVRVAGVPQKCRAEGFGGYVGSVRVHHLLVGNRGFLPMLRSASHCAHDGPW